MEEGKRRVGKWILKDDLSMKKMGGEKKVEEIWKRKEGWQPGTVFIY